MQFLEFTLCKTDPDVWIHKTVMEDGTPYWKYILFYTNDVFIMSHIPVDVFTEIGRHLKLKESSIGHQKLYFISLGEKTMSI